MREKYLPHPLKTGVTLSQEQNMGLHAQHTTTSSASACMMVHTTTKLLQPQFSHVSKKTAVYRFVMLNVLQHYCSDSGHTETNYACGLVGNCRFIYHQKRAAIPYKQVQSFHKFQHDFSEHTHWWSQTGNLQTTINIDKELTPNWPCKFRSETRHMQ